MLNRKAVVAAAALLAAAFAPLRAQTGPPCTISGRVTANALPLPGVVLALTTPDGQAVDVTSTAPDGTYVLKAPAAGTLTLTAELTAFATLTRTMAIDRSACPQRLDLAMTLASRAPAAPAAGRAGDSAEAPAAAAGPGRGGRGTGSAATRAARGRGQGAPAFQSLDLLADQNAPERADESAGTENGAQAVLPPGFSPDSAVESIASIGSSQAADAFVGPGGFNERAAFGEGGPFGGEDGGAGRGGFGRGPGAFGGLGPAVFIAGRGRGGNQIRGSVFQSVDTSALDTAPIAINGQTTSKPQYLQQRFGATLGGPIAIPKVWDSARTFFFLNYTGNHSSNPYDAYSTVPTLAERAGDFSAASRTIVNPATGQPFPNNQIPASSINPASQALLSLFPAPNQAGLQNFHSVATTSSQLDDVNVRLVHVFGAPPADRGPGRNAGPGGGVRGAFGGRGGGFGGRGGREGVSNLNLAVHFRHADNSSPNPYPALGGATRTTAWDIPVNYSFTRGGLTHAIRFQFNRQHAESQNLFAFSRNVAGDAGLAGISSDPFDWGAPNLSFTNVGGIHDMAPAARTDETIGIGDTLVKTRGQHTVRFGGDWRVIRADSRSDPNARGSYVFTGLYSGLDFADFLLGLPQQATAQYGPGTERFRQHTGDLFVQDDWRVRATLTVNAGLRYEYFSPLSEADNRLVTLDAPAAFTAAVPVTAGGTGPFSGVLPDTIVRPFRRGFAPRIGIAWKAQANTTVRAGYGINYNASPYQAIAQQLASQPPYAVTNTALGTLAAPIPLQTALLDIPPGVTTNTFGVDPDYRLGSAQIWNLDVQRDLARTYTLGIGYTGTKGTDLDVLRAPNRNPDGTLRIAGVQPFLWESSSADSLMNALTLRFRRRLNHGFAAGASYTLSKSTDDASSIGGTAGVVAQNDQDLEAERGLSSFDQRHRFSGNFIVELPFGPGKPWLQNGTAAALFGGWQVNGTVQFASGTPFTARVLGSVRDVATGVNGTLRANYDGEPIASADPTTLAFFNTAAFSVPPPGTFGSAGRNTIIGPGTSVLNLGVMRNIDLGSRRVLTLQLTAANVLNTIQWASIDTVVNSPTFGRVTAARPMRRVQIVTRIRF
ncbi:MAG TPA: TonB-dependent receptor [Vicinamibacterales bacterium]|nr:TonB-dependent receptor [Vicinamibacterales bacterium]